MKKRALDELNGLRNKIEEQIKTTRNTAQDFKRTWEDAKQKILEKAGVFCISTLITNVGGSPISMRSPGLLRIFIGAQDYVDIKLHQENYKGDQVPLNGSRSFVFASDEIEALPRPDKDQINRYWGQSVYAMLFVQDTLGKIHSSNRIPFAEGLYEKIIYDQLTAEASKPRHEQQR